MSDSMSRIDYVLSRLEGVRTTSNGWEACCPAHDDQKQSLTVTHGDNGNIVVKCHAGDGCPIDAIVAGTGLDIEDFNAPQSDIAQRRKPDKRYSLDQIKSWPETKAIYEYHSETGELLFVVRRMVEEYEEDGEKKLRKTFRQYRRVGGDKFVANMQGMRRILYRMPELLAGIQRGDRVFVVEGEKDVENLMAVGLVATCNVGGALKFPAAESPIFKGADVVIIEDNDKPGIEHARRVSELLVGLAVSVRVLRLPDLPEHGDVSDWLEAGGTVERLLELAGHVTPEVAPAPPFRDEEYLTDIGNCNRLVRRHKDDLCFNNAIDWLVWTGSRWEKDETGAVVRKAKATMISILEEEAKAPDLRSKDREELLDHAMKSQSNGRIRAAISLAESELPVRTAQLDADAWVLNVRNGAIDLRTCTLREHRRTDFSTKLAPVTWDDNAECPLWLKFLDRAMDGNQALISYLQRVAGYSLTGATSEEIMFLAHGSGRNGKGTYVETLVAMLGDYAAGFPTEMLLEAKTQTDGGGPTPHIARLKGARFAHASETTEGRRLAEAFVKKATGSDTLTARYCHGNPFDFLPTHKLFLAVNHRPIIRGSDEGIWSRIHLIPFTVFIPPAERDPELKQKLREHELPGILKWAVQGCRDWQRGGMDPPAEVLAATSEYRSESDTIGMFFEDCCDKGPELFATTQTLYKAYCAWAAANGKSSTNQVNFGRMISARSLRPGKRMFGYVRHRTWEGIGLKQSLRADDSGHADEDEQPPMEPMIFDDLPSKPGYEGEDTYSV